MDWTCALSVTLCSNKRFQMISPIRQKYCGTFDGPRQGIPQTTFFENPPLKTDLR